MSESPELTQNAADHADRRTHTRHRIRALAYVELGKDNGGIVLNISEGGFAVRAAEPIQEDGLSRLRFQMQHATQPLEMSGKIAWTGDSGKEAGVRFTDLREEALSEIRTWIIRETSPPMPKQSPLARRAYREPPRENESIRNEFLSDEVSEAEAQDNGDGQIAAPPAIPESNSKSPDPKELKALAEKQRFGAMLFPKEASAPAIAPLPVNRAPAIEKLEPVLGAQKSPENWTDFRIEMGKGWMVAALITLLVAISFAGGMAVRRNGLSGLRTAETVSSTGAQSENPISAASPAKPSSKPLQIEIIDSSNQRWVIPASPSAIHSEGNGEGIASNSVPHDSSDNLGTLASGLSQPPEHQEASKASAAPGQKGRAPILLSLPERSLSASDSVAISSQRSFIVPAESSPGASQPGKNLQVGQLVNLVDPAYPPDAEQKHIEGTVKLHATIGADGSIKDLQPLSGPPSLLPAALTAVREWRYNPTLLNGQPIETQEDISLVFRLPK